MKRALTGLVALLIAAPPALAQGEAYGPTMAPQVEAWKMGAIALTMGVVPQSHALRAEARFYLTPLGPNQRSVRFRLHPGLRVTRADVQWRPARFTRSGEWLTVQLGPTAANKPVALTIGYAGRPLEAVKRQRRQDVGNEGLALQPDGRWYPLPASTAPGGMSLRLTVPGPWRAVSPASKQAFDRDTQTYRFEYKGAPEPVIAARLKAVTVGGVSTYVRLADGGAAEPELKRATTLLDVFRAHGVGAQKLSGTVVELPADFQAVSRPRFQGVPRQPGGLARWLSGAQWALPASASPLERQWLGAGLGAYSDELLAERQGGRAAYAKAVAKRREAYESFLDEKPQLDTALSEPIAPNTEAHAGVVVAKGAMVWAKWREAIGDEAFWGVLKRYQAGLAKGQPAWTAFQAAAGEHSAWLDAWLYQSGLPAFKLADVAVTGEEGAYQVTGRLVPDGALAALPVELALVSIDDVQHLRFTAFGPEMPFHFVSATRPLRVMLDPDNALPLRRRDTLLVPQGAAPEGGLIVYGTTGGDEETAANMEAAKAMADRLSRRQKLELPVKADTELTEGDRKRSLLLFGRPATNALADEWADQFPVRFLTGKGLWWQGRTYTQPDFGTVQIIANPDAPGHTVVLFAALSAKHMADTLEYTHESSTFCVFDGGHLVEAGRALNTFPDQDAVLY